MTHLIMIFNSFFEYGFINNIKSSNTIYYKDYNDGFVPEIKSSSNEIDKAIQVLKERTGENL